MLARKIVVGFGIAAIFRRSSIMVSARSIRRRDYRTTSPFSLHLRRRRRRERKALAAEQVKQRATFAEAARSFARVMFAISTVLGVIAIVLGAYLASHAVGAGLILGGISSLALGYWAYAMHLDDWFRFLSLLAGSPPCSS
jgi:hypothetical protein